MSAKPRVNLILDSLILVAFLLTVASGLDLEHDLRSSLAMSQGHGIFHHHSLAAFTFIGLILIHQLFHWKWIMSQLKQLIKGSRRPAQAREG